MEIEIIMDEIARVSQAVSGKRKPNMYYYECIVDHISMQLGIAKDKIKGRCRKDEFAHARFIAIVQMYHPGFVTFEDIGRFFGMHHTSIIHGYYTVMDLERKYDPVFYEKYMLCEND